MEKSILRSPKAGAGGRLSPRGIPYFDPAEKPNTALEVSASPPKPTLSPSQQTELERLEAVIKGGWKTFLEVGEALAQVRDKELYKGKYDSFEEYWRIELGYSRSYAYNLIGSAEVNEQLSSIEDFKDKPLNESQLRELISVPEGKRAEAWKNAVKLAGDKPLTARIVHKAALKFKPRKAAKSRTSKPASAKPVNIKPALKLIDEAAGLAQGNVRLLDRLKALRVMLQEWAGKTA
jgi:hypothetical protein